jgi:hypothetical protein
VAELADALLPFAPRSQNSVSRISGILRSVSLRPVSADKSPSSERTLQSPGTGNPITGNPVSGDQPTEVDRVRVVTPAPAARSEKSTRTDWEATPSLVRRSRRRVVIVTAVAVGAVLAGLVVWQTRPRVSFEPAPDVSVPQPTGATAAVEGPTPSALAPVAAPASVAPPAPSTVGPAPSVAAPAAQAHGPTKVFTKPKVVAAPSVVAPPPSAPVKPKAADPLDGRR